MTKLDQILLNGNNVALVCGHTLSLPAGEPAPIDPPCALAVGAGRQPKLRLGFGAVCGARDREEVLRLSPRSGLDGTARLENHDTVSHSTYVFGWAIVAATMGGQPVTCVFLPARAKLFDGIPVSQWSVSTDTRRAHVHTHCH